MSDFGNIINAFLNNSSGIIESYVFWKEQRGIRGNIEFCFRETPFNGKVY